MQNHDLLKKHSIRQHVQIVPTPSDREVVLDAQRRLVEDPEDADALFAVAAWDEIVGDLVNALDLVNRLGATAADYPGVSRPRARNLKGLGKERTAIASEKPAPRDAETEIP